MEPRHPYSSPVSRHPYLVTPFRGLVAAALCLLLAGCGVIQIGVSNSPDWCPNRDSKGCL